MPDKKPVDQAKAESLRKWAEVMQDPRNDLLHKISHVLLDVDLMKDVEDAIQAESRTAQAKPRGICGTKSLTVTNAGISQALLKKSLTRPAQTRRKSQTRTPGRQNNSKPCLKRLPAGRLPEWTSSLKAII